MSEITSFLQLPKDRLNGRFTLLFLEYNEYLLQDLAVYKYDAPTGSDTWMRSVSSRVSGRLKLCTRGLVFEPTSDPRQALVRFPFKGMVAPLAPYELAPGSAAASGVDASTLFALACNKCVDLEREGRVAPFVPHEFEQPKMVVFQLQHSTVKEFLSLAGELQQTEMARSAWSGSGGMSKLIAERLGEGDDQSFELRHLVDFSEQLLTPTARVDRVRPLVRNPGLLAVTNRELYFQPSAVNNVGAHVEHFPLRKVCAVVKRRHMLRHTGLELSLTDGATALFNFSSPKERDTVFDVLLAQPAVAAAVAQRDLRRAVAAWQKREMSNFDYLAFLNSVGDRSVHDLTQYPVYPWVIADYESSQLDLDNPATFRDLSKPMGALDPTRLSYFLERFESMPPEDPACGSPPPFLYGSHYSTPGFVLHYLVRAAPQHMLSLQNGKFDAPDRLFANIHSTWQSVSVQNPSDVKELIPEFYSGDGSFLRNVSDLPLGVTQEGVALGDVALPPWAKSPRDFVKKCRKALESEHVSNNLHLWIDLIFGHKQRGEEAVKNHNLFYYLTYEGAVDLEAVTDPGKRAAYESQINEFGQCPKQLFRSAHPSRNAPSSSLNALNLAPDLESASHPAHDGGKSVRSDAPSSAVASTAAPAPAASSSEGASIPERPMAAPKAALPKPPPPPRPVSPPAVLPQAATPKPKPPPPPRQKNSDLPSAAPSESLSGLHLRAKGESLLSKVGSGLSMGSELAQNLFQRNRSGSGSGSIDNESTIKAAMATDGVSDPSSEPLPPSLQRVSSSTDSRPPEALKAAPLSTGSFAEAAAPAAAPPTATSHAAPPPLAPVLAPSTPPDPGLLNMSEWATPATPSPSNKDPNRLTAAPKTNDSDDVDDDGPPGVIDSSTDEDEGSDSKSPKSAPFLPAATTPPTLRLDHSIARDNNATSNSDLEARTRSASSGVPVAMLGHLQLWSTARVAPASQPLRAHRDLATCVKISADGTLAASTGKDGALRITPIAAFAPLKASAAAPTTSTTTTAPTASAATVAGALPPSAPGTAASHGRRRLFQATDLCLSACALVEMPPKPTTASDSSEAAPAPGAAASSSPPDVVVVCGSWDSSLLLYSVNSACVLGARISQAHDDSVSCVDASASRALVASGSWDATVKLWGFKRARSSAPSLRAARGGSTTDSPAGAASSAASLPFVGLVPTPLAEIFDHTSPVLSVAFGPGADFVASGADDGRVVVSNVAGLGSAQSEGGGSGEGEEQGEALCAVELSELGGGHHPTASTSSSGGGSSNGGFDGPHAALALAWGGGGNDNSGSSNNRRRSSSAAGLQLFVASRDGMVRELAVPGGYCRVAVRFPALSPSMPAVPWSLAVSGALVAAAGSGGCGQVALWAWPASASAAAPHLFDTASSSSSSSTGSSIDEGSHESDAVVSLALHADSQLLVAAAGANLRLWTINNDAVPPPL